MALPDRQRLAVATRIAAAYITAGIYPTDKQRLAQSALEIADELILRTTPVVHDVNSNGGNND